MSFIKLTDDRGSDVWIRATHIVAVQPGLRFGPASLDPVGSTVFLDIAGPFLVVRQSPDEVLALIEASA